MASLQLSRFPEELLERILSHCAVGSLSQPARPSWHRPGGSSESTPPIRGRLALLLASKMFLRICTPLFYDTVLITSANQLHRLLSDALHPSPFLASHIRRVVLAGIWADGGELLRICGANLKMLDITLDVTQLAPAVSSPVRDLDAEDFCEGLNELKSLKHFVIRKPNNVYLTHPKPRSVLSGIAKAMHGWDNLEHADIAFRLSDDSGVNSFLPPIPRVVPSQQGPITALTQSLGTRPKLHTLSTILPSVWNETILRISVNPSLERIILGDGNTGHSGGMTWPGRDFYAGPVSAMIVNGSHFLGGHHGIAPTSLFMLGAKKHARLSELIRAGTSIIRTRAQTLGTPPSSPTLLPASHPDHISASYAPLSLTNHQNVSNYYMRSQSIMPSNEAAQPDRPRLSIPTSKRPSRRAEGPVCQPLAGSSSSNINAGSGAATSFPSRHIC